MRTVLTRIKRLEQVWAVEESNRPLRLEFAYLKLLPRDYTGLRHGVKIGEHADGSDECEERPGPPPPGHHYRKDPNVIRVYFVSAPPDPQDDWEPNRRVVPRAAANLPTDITT